VQIYRPSPLPGILVGNGPQEGAESSKRENFLDTPNPTPLKASYLHRSRSRFPEGGPWVKGQGWEKRGGDSTLSYQIN